MLADGRNDLEPAAIKLQPVIADVLAALRDAARLRAGAHVRLGRDLLWTVRVIAARPRRRPRELSAAHPRWWVKATVLG